MDLERIVQLLKEEPVTLDKMLLEIESYIKEFADVTVEKEGDSLIIYLYNGQAFRLVLTEEKPLTAPKHEEAPKPEENKEQQKNKKEDKK